ncbi:hypothetical protein Poli38472_007890 [Pythium oligandrum]|uniref:Cation-transporting ATPase n=1 Tax=Pythium oligandrum TaxID=41045 RepID=A0A8K1FS50_PYTOL|nr:hypothetical protein Poli38472_007890 [Pythium oligandrum]|eukprot:TMW68218.1 hypothetical protein Poli38472_007890 [Pythium oligandrum]
MRRLQNTEGHPECGHTRQSPAFRNPTQPTTERTNESREATEPVASVMPVRSLQEHLVVPVDDMAGRRGQLVYAPSEYVRIVPYAFSYVRMALYGVLLLCTGGLLLIVSVWFPQLFTQIARMRLPYSSLGEAEYMLVLVHEDGFRSKWVEVKVHRPTKKSRAEASEDRTKLPWVWFEFKKHRYVFDHEMGEFRRYLATMNEDLEKVRDRLANGWDTATAQSKVELFGPNVVDIDPPFVPMLLFTKLVHPYYLFQIFSAIVWFNQGYTVYAIVILVLSAFSMTWEIYSEVSNSNRLRSLVRSDQKVQVFRQGAISAAKMITLHETDLVPGDIVELTMGTVPADILLLSGGCVVDEASLTGEPIPINKEPAAGMTQMTEAEARTNFKSSFLHSGSTITRVRKTKDACKGVVLSTGFSTGKGELFRSIIFPREITFEFERDSYRYLAVLATIAIAAFIKRIVDFSHDGYGFGYMIVESLDLVTIAVPPALPLVLSSGIGFALHRLKRGGIFCIDSQRINSCGQLSCFCFDKTGTLTKESLDLVGVDIVNPEDNKLKHVGFDIPEMFRLAMATCHSLSEANGAMQGYALELAMFEAAKLKLEFNHDRSNSKHSATVSREAASDSSVTETFGVVKKFLFDPTCQRSSVVVENMQTKQRYVFVKGSPEALREIATPNSTPSDFKLKSLRYSAEGNYCIGFGVRVLGEGDPLNLDSRDAVEKDVAFMGIALFHNEVKPEAKGMLHELYEADIDVRVITGDNALTAVHVGRLLDMKLKSKVAIVDVDESSDDTMFHCVESLRMADEVQWESFSGSNMSRVMAEYDIALTGAALERLKTEMSEESLKQLVSKTYIFARIRPQQKAWIVETLMDLGQIVGMVGDGTNDCGALKAAHVGLALSSAEASIVAPFTSKAKAVTDVPVLIREGRCALTTSFLGFKFMVLYPIIQLGMASTLGHFGTMLSNNQYLWDDLAIVLGLAITMLYTASSKKLSRERPPNTLFSVSIVASILGQVALYIAFFAGMFALLNHQSWFCPRGVGMDMMTAYVDNPSSISSAVSDPMLLSNCAFYTGFADTIETEVDDIEVSHEDSEVWLFAHLQYYSVAAAFNIKDPFRMPFYTNITFTLLFILGLGVNLWFLLDTSNLIGDTFQTLPLESAFRIKMLLMFIGHIIASVLWEMVATWFIPKWRLEKADAKTDLEDIDIYIPTPNEAVVNAQA